MSYKDDVDIIVPRPASARSCEGDVATDGGAVVRVPISSLRTTGWLRVHGEDPEHVRLLAESTAPLPPVLVHRPTMCVVDGRHRMRAAVLRGELTLPVRFLDCDEDRAFLLSVRANIEHGLPLSLADRKAAAARVVERHPAWSDRRVAALVGLSADSVAVVRRTASAGSGQVTARIGRDGRVRPIDSAQGRLRAGRVLADRPDATLREIAKEAGIALGTARDVRDRVRRGLDPVPERRGRAAAPREAEQASVAMEVEDAVAALQALKKDPSLRFTESGRRLLRWLVGHAVKPEDQAWVVPSVPPHCKVLIADVARQYALMWHGFAEVLEQQERKAI